MSDENIGDKYQQETKYSPNSFKGGGRPEKRPDPYKSYKGKEKVSVEVELPEEGVWLALANRRSRRTFTSDPMEKQHLAKLVWAAQGPTAKAGDILLRTAPSAGALYPIETYLVVNNVKDIESGVYHYNIRENALERIEEGSFGRALAEAALGQGMCVRAGAVFVFTAVVDRSKWKYAQRAYRYIYMDAGHIGQNVYLAAEALGLGCCAIGAFFDDQANDIIGVDGEEETVVYLIAVGKAKQGWLE